MQNADPTAGIQSLYGVLYISRGSGYASATRHVPRGVGFAVRRIGQNGSEALRVGLSGIGHDVRPGGWIEDGILCYEYNLFIIQRTKIRSREKLPTGKAKIEIETRYAVPRPAGPLKVTMKVGGKVVAEGTVPVSAPLIFTAK
jgi:hypothetical protein